MEVPEGDELLDLVDENDQVVGQELRSVVYARDILNVRVVNLFIKNSEGQLWVPRRVATKRNYPLCLDMSMGGHVGSGESYEEALRRELMEELRIDLDSSGCRKIGHLTPKDGTFAFMNIYEIQQDTVPDFNKEDFVEYFWLQPQEVLDKIAAGDKSKEDLPILIRRFYLP